MISLFTAEVSVSISGRLVPLYEWVCSSFELPDLAGNVNCLYSCTYIVNTSMVHVYATAKSAIFPQLFVCAELHVHRNSCKTRTHCLRAANYDCCTTRCHENSTTLGRQPIFTSHRDAHSKPLRTSCSPIHSGMGNRYRIGL